jgi:hypothetical protein
MRAANHQSAAHRHKREKFDAIKDPDPDIRMQADARQGALVIVTQASLSVARQERDFITRVTHLFVAEIFM